MDEWAILIRTATYIIFVFAVVILAALSTIILQKKSVLEKMRHSLLWVRLIDLSGNKRILPCHDKM